EQPIRMLRCEHISASPRGDSSHNPSYSGDFVRSVRFWRTGRKALECHVFGRKWSRRAIIGSAVAVLVLIAAVALLRSRSGVQVAQVPFSDLLQHLDRGALAEVVVNGDTLDFKLRSGEAFRTTAPAN